MGLFSIRGSLNARQKVLFSIVGILVTICLWWVIAEAFSDTLPVAEERIYVPTELEAKEEGINRDSLLQVDSIQLATATTFKKIYPILPRPDQVVQSFPSLFSTEEGGDNLISNMGLSVWLNVRGYFWAIVVAIPLGFLIGLIPLFKGLFSGQVNALRYLPLTALTGLFMNWFGIEETMKIAFLAFGIIVYLLPVVFQRIDEVDDVYLTAVSTLGASKWQMITSVYFPAVFSKLIDDIRVLTAISWTYIIIAELLNRQGGLGSLIFTKGKQGDIPKVFAILVVIVIIGFIQDRVFAYLDKRLFPHKYDKMHKVGLTEVWYGLGLLFLVMVMAIFSGILGGASWMPSLVIIGGMAALVMLAWGEWRIFSGNVENNKA